MNERQKWLIEIAWRCLAIGASGFILWQLIEGQTELARLSGRAEGWLEGLEAGKLVGDVRAGRRDIHA